MATRIKTEAQAPKTQTPKGKTAPKGKGKEQTPPTPLFGFNPTTEEQKKAWADMLPIMEAASKASDALTAAQALKKAIPREKLEGMGFPRAVIEDALENYAGTLNKLWKVTIDTSKGGKPVKASTDWHAEMLVDMSVKVCGIQREAYAAADSAAARKKVTQRATKTLQRMLPPKPQAPFSVEQACSDFGERLAKLDSEIDGKKLKEWNPGKLDASILKDPVFLKLVGHLISGVQAQRQAEKEAADQAARDEARKFANQ